MNTTVNHDEKNGRIISALRSGAPYWLLTADDEHYALVQVGTDRIPVPILRKLLGGYESDSLITKIGYVPDLEIERDTKVEKAPGSLLHDIVTAMLQSIEDDADHKGYWSVDRDGKSASITTTFSRDPRMSNNGGSYYFYQTYSIEAQGVLTKEDWSCDISPLDGASSLFLFNLTDLNDIFALAAKVVVQVLKGEQTVVCETCGHPYTHTSKEV